MPEGYPDRAPRGRGDWLALGAKELYWWPSSGRSESALDLKAIEKLLGPMTIRTHRTVTRMADKLF